MADKVLNTRIIQKHDSTENWKKAVNFIPKLGEIIIYDDAPERIKIGDGISTVSQLPFTLKSEIYHDEISQDTITVPLNADTLNGSTKQEILNLAKSNYQNERESKQIIIPVEAWTGNSCTITNHIFIGEQADYLISSDPSSIKEYSRCGVYCEKLDTGGTAIFKALAGVPAQNLTINVRRIPSV